MVTIVGTIIAIVVSAVGVWYTRRQVLPAKRELWVTVPSSASLLTENADVHGVRVESAAGVISDPYVTTVVLRNRGTHDITTSSFNDRHPLRIDLGVPIVDLSSALAPPRKDGPGVAVDDSELSIAPFLLAKDQQLAIQILTEGRPAEHFLSSGLTHELIDTDVQLREPASGGRRAIGVLLVSTAATVIASLAAVAGVTVFLTSLNSTSADCPSTLAVRPSDGAPGSSITIAGDGVDRYALISASMPGGYESSDLGETQASSKGEFSLIAKIPDDAELGYTEIDVVVNGADEFESCYKDLQFVVRKQGN